MQRTTNNTDISLEYIDKKKRKKVISEVDIKNVSLFLKILGYTFSVIILTDLIVRLYLKFE